MRYFALATDYDGTLAHDGIVNPQTLEALQRLRESGRHLLLVTGRQLPDLEATFPEFEIFERIVAENGALVYDPASKTETLLSQAPPPEFAAALHRKGVVPLAVGRVIVATLDNHRETVLDTIRELGLELQVIFNKGSLMVLPSGINKATGLKPALAQLHLSAHNTVGVGDAENDHAFIEACECAVAVANALQSVKDHADLVTAGARGNGVVELIERLLDNDLDDVADDHDHSILLGKQPQNGDVCISAYGSTLLVVGSSGGGKSTLMTGVMERLVDNGYQFCVLDPEGDYQSFEGALILGDAKRGAAIEEILTVLDQPGQSVIVNLLGVPVEERPVFFESLLPRITEMRAHTGRPHWLILDEAHHLTPAQRGPARQALPQDLTGVMLVTLKPDRLPQELVASTGAIVAMGDESSEALEQFGGTPGPELKLERGQALFWSRKQGGEPVLFEVAPCRTERTRHSRKYATAELTPDRSFYFRGPDSKLNLRAQNLMIFTQLLDGVDDETWLFHLRGGEYSKWFRENIKNDELADAGVEIEKASDLPAQESRKRIKEAIEQRYTLPG